jgi:hypothetical protein
MIARHLPRLARLLSSSLVLIPALAFADPVGPASGLAGAGPGPAPGASAADDVTYNMAFEQRAHETCLQGVPAGVSQANAGRFCDCVIAQLAPLGVAQKESLTPSSPAFVSATQACRGYLQPG